MTTMTCSVRHRISASAERTSRPVGTELRQQRVRAVLHERHLARCDPIEGRLARVVDADAQPGLGEGEAERQADVAAAAEDDEVEVGGQEDRWSCAQDSRGPSGAVASPHGQRSIGGENDGVLVGIGRVPAGVAEPLDKGLVVGGDDDDRDAPAVEDRLPAHHAVRDRRVVVPDLRREDLDPRVEGDRHVRQRELEPRAPGLRIEEPIAGSGDVPEGSGDARRGMADDADGRAQAGVGRPPDGQEDDSDDDQGRNDGRVDAR